MQTGENVQALRKILDMTRLISIAILALHFYYYCYAAFNQWGIVSTISDKLMGNVSRTGLFDYFDKTKFFSLGFLIISMIGIRGKKSEKIDYRTGLAYLLSGLALYYFSYLGLFAPLSISVSAITYMAITSTGYLLMLSGGTMLSRIIRSKLNGKDIFNKENETFPQEERLLENEFSINLPTQYQLKNRSRKGWINIINPFRGVLIAGTPGSGKSYFVFRHVLSQLISKGFCLFVYDFKFDDLTKIAYNYWLRYKHLYKVPPRFCVINFDDLSRSHRCNPLEPSQMIDIIDAAESARTILVGLNREWIKKQGDFFVESPINFLTAVIWYLRRYRDGEFCTLPHVIEFMQLDYDSLFTILRTEKEVEVFINPFLSAYLNDAMEQLEGQIASAKIAMARLASPQLYYVMSGNEFSLDINNPDDPKIFCAGNNPQKIQTYGAVLSLYSNRLVKQVNQKGKIKTGLVYDEFPTQYQTGIDTLIATARSNKVATFLGVQDLSQLRKDYGKEQADVIVNIVGNIVSGQVTGETAKLLSERFGKIMQDRESISINSSDTSISKSKQLDSAIPPSKIAALSSGEFVGMVADNPDCKIDLKAFHCEIINDHQALKAEEDAFVDIPKIRNIDNAIVQRNYLQIKQDVQQIIHTEMEALLSDPETAHLIIRKAG